MKIYHFTLVFILFFLVAVIHTDITIGKMKAIEKEQATLSSNLNSATSDAIEYLAATGTTGANNINKEMVAETFFHSMYTSMGIMSDLAAQRELNLYIPIMLLCDVDGYYVYYYDEYLKDGVTLTDRMWSEKMVYSYVDENFIYRFTLTDKIYLYDPKHLLGKSELVIEENISDIRESIEYASFRTQYPESFLFVEEEYELIRKSVILEHLEKAMNYYINQHNFIAMRNGIQYEFTFSNTSREWASNIDDVNIIVVFQGYPYMNSRDYRFNKIDSASANIVKKKLYYVEERSWYRLAHVKGCEKLKDNLNLLDEVFDSEEAYAKIGAYSCECIEHGIRVPSLVKKSK